MRRHNSNITDAIHADRSIGSFVRDAAHKRVARCSSFTPKLLDLWHIELREVLCFSNSSNSAPKTPGPIASIVS